jgi:hypothetical protein
VRPFGVAELGVRLTKMTLRKKIILWWSAIILTHLVYWFFNLPLSGNIAGWLPLISRIWIPFISRKIGYFAIFLFVLSIALTAVAVMMLIRLEHPSMQLIQILAAIGGGCSWMFLITLAISDFLTFRDNDKIA